MGILSNREVLWEAGNAASLQAEVDNPLQANGYASFLPHVKTLWLNPFHIVFYFHQCTNQDDGYLREAASFQSALATRPQSGMILMCLQQHL